MTLLFIEGYDDQAGALRVFSQDSHGTQTGARTGTYCREFSDSAEHDTYRLEASDEHATLIAGMGFSVEVIDTDYFNIFRFRGDGGTTEHVSLSVHGDGSIEVFRGLSDLDGGVSLGTTDPGVLSMEFLTWHYIELYVTLSDTVGEIKLRVDDVTPAGWSDLTNQDTKNGGTDAVFDTMSFYGARNHNDWRGDDMYICNGAGGVADDLLGECKVEYLLPDGDGNYNDGVGSDGNSVDNYLMVNDTALPDTSSYVGIETVGEKESFTYEDLVTAAGTVHGVMLINYFAKSDSGAKSARWLARRSATDANGADITLSTSMLQSHELLVLDPTDASAWTVPNVNAMEWGFEART